MIRTSTTTDPGVLSGHSLGEIGIVATDGPIHDARVVSYAPATGANWTDPDPATVQEGLDNIAAGLIVGLAPVNASYVCISSNATLTAERTLAVGTGLSLADGGANSTATISVNAAAMAALLDHGTLAGLADDDHTIYFKADGTRNLTGTSTITTNAKWQFRDTNTYINSTASGAMTVSATGVLTLTGSSVAADQALFLCATAAKFSRIGPTPNTSSIHSPSDSNDRFVVVFHNSASGAKRASTAYGEITGPSTSATARISAQNLYAVIGGLVDANLTSTSNQGAVCCSRFYLATDNSNTLTVSSACNLALKKAYNAGGSDLTLTLYDDIRIEGGSVGIENMAAAEVITTWNRVRIHEPVVVAGATITNLYGVHLDAFDVGSNNYEIFLEEDGGIFFRAAAQTIYSNAANQLTIAFDSSLFITPASAAGATVINDGGINHDFRVESDTKANMLFLDASADKIGINQGSPAGAVVHLTNDSGTAQPLLRLDQDNSGTQFIDFDGTIDTGAHVTVSHWAKVTTGNGANTYYLPLYD